MGKNKYIGSNFDDFLKEEGMLEEIEEVYPKQLKIWPLGCVKAADKSSIAK